MKLDQNLVDKTKEFIINRFGEDEDFMGASAMYTKSGKILISTAPDMPNGSVDFCHETGAIAEAYKLNEEITASVCLSREKGKYYVLTPCGVCQERLYTWGSDVEVAVPKNEDPTKWEAKNLKEVQPYYWKNPFINS